ncbi:uncharacterized protein AKAW2_10291A [Aspergillus luchuensis]|uniref:Uncharacterized protein n=1 Tax=Aspergillus kawachii TaxID=1069201 RepID=A0A7R7ZSL5_ASPKA|nr:uncharacterized protein AKAW2_10291A [Aspergillus luchuensis]BCR93245.1 hypothetical protein AKAW2_10291A [Aspergillus luchuensis]
MNLASSRVSDCYNILTHPRQFPSIPLVAEPAEERGGGKHYLQYQGGKEQARLKRRCPLFACDQASDGVPELLRQGPIHAQESAPKVSRLTPVTEFSAKQLGG